MVSMMPLSQHLIFQNQSLQAVGSQISSISLRQMDEWLTLQVGRYLLWIKSVKVSFWDMLEPKTVFI